MKSQRLLLVGSLVFACLVLVGLYLSHRVQIKIERSLATTECKVLAWEVGKQVLSQNGFEPEKEEEIAEVDRWGTEYKIAYSVSVREHILSVRVTSAGPDREFETDDDIDVVERMLAKSES